MQWSHFHFSLNFTIALTKLPTGGFLSHVFFVSPSRLKRPDRTDIAMWKSILTFAALVANAANAASSAASTCDSYEEATLLQLPPLSPDEQDEKDICRFNS